MAKKSNQPYKKYISVMNNSELYKLNKQLTEKDSFNLNEDETEALSVIFDSKKDIIINITEYDIINNPTLILSATNKTEIVRKVKERINSLDQMTRDTYLALFDYWYKNKMDSDSENEGKAFIELDKIHFDYRGLTGKNKDSTLTDIQYETYLQMIDVLSNTKVSIDITNETNIAYEKIKNLNWSAIEGRLIDNLRYIYNDKKKVIGIWYDMGVVGEAYTQYIPQINDRYPTALLQLPVQSKIAKNIGNYICYLHRCNRNTGNKYTLLNFYNIVGESGYEINPPHIQQGINRFLKHLDTSIKVLKSNNIITHIEIPTDINSKNYKDKEVQLKIFWNYKNNI